MGRLLPMPWHSLMLLVVWLLLNGVSYGQLLLGTILGLLIPIMTYPYVRGHAPIQKPFSLVVYGLRLVWDIVVANLDVARRILLPNRFLKPGWLVYPLSMSEPFPVTILASSISLTPGTVSVEFSEDRSCLYIHVLHLTDEDELIAFIRRRYEQPLKEIFGC
ncbi:MAG: Na+/H+ antiporter subunit E [Thalassolituus sp.]|uniref:Na+/H+ antiporter subunit E n=1 Tax=Thalassolituus maritimus TaxID=484498 RepID=A0ABQ0A3H9_9GAMM|nr:Na+/H+ antiporter subunit E [Pseudomonadota bacterium]MEC8104199.1 Na+/H+ antiporter subunit E [Pseudomonadota bacterium]MEC8523419.1 Na+/H+ antiporter subunit E [Pseudomonadota bacterium]TNC86034.1 MAG: Na+/H+ antiporter subunit E [Thalassolituus sp.]